ncbi:hypothetical protein EZS27_000880 [termite gut metagenome]|uniref:DUF4855 domain-containing protein n=1 Tax=termite gut metagenome TaxID=433724 RepID=A0A5J4T2T2_9ZZZZ
MKKCIILSLCLCCLFACGEDEARPIPTYPGTGDTDDLTTELYDWEKNRKEIIGSTDMVLLYGGGHHRNPHEWDKSRLNPYVKYVDTGGTSHWMFDSFLFLEIMDQGEMGANKMFANGYGLESANKTDWNNLINYYFQSNTGIGALDASIGEAISVLGSPQQKRQIVLCIPEPIVYQHPGQSTSSTKYWGMVDNKTLDFLNPNDRIKACQWYIDQVRAKFNEKKYQHVELAGFYWIAEKATDTRTILNKIATYLNKMNYSFNWIPYYGADGYNQWNSLGFNYAYLQPNYFFNESVPDSRLRDACQQALDNNMNMELEFDDNALASRGKSYRLRNYMDVFKEYRIWEKKRLAYYQGGASLLALKNSGNTADTQLYHEFCTFVISRPIRSSH